jgi:hypothetical protein
MSRHNFTVGTPQNKAQEPLTVQQIAERAPSALAVRPYAEMSSKYTYVPTMNIIEGMLKAGFQPFAASQSLTRIADKKEFTKHMIRFRHQDAGRLVVGDVVPEVVVINSHDGACAFRLIAGLYRLVCSNGLMVSDAEIESISVRHTGNVLKDVVDGSYSIVENAARTLATVQKWVQLELTDGERHAFASAAHTLRFADAHGKTTTPITADQLLVPRRREDIGTDLWKTFNVTQENILAGGLSAIQRDAEGRRVRRVSSREIKGIDQSTQLNRALWELAAKMAELKSPKKSEVPFAEVEVVAA